MSSFDDFIFLKNPELPRGFNVYLPRPITSEFLDFAAIHACRLPYFSNNSVHLLAVANSGVPIATSILLRRRYKQLKGFTDDALSIVDPYRHNLIIGSEVEAEVQIIVDNSIKSVSTINHVIYKVKQLSLPPIRYVFKLIDYEDQYEQELHEHLSKLGLLEVSAFKLSEVIDGVSREQRSRLTAFLNSVAYRRI